MPQSKLNQLQEAIIELVYKLRLLFLTKIMRYKYTIGIDYGSGDGESVYCIVRHTKDGTKRVERLEAFSKK